MMKIEASRSAFSSCNDRFMKNYKQDVPFERQMEILRDIEYVDAIPVTYSPDTDPAALRGFMAQFGISPGTVVLDTYSQPRRRPAPRVYRKGQGRDGLLPRHRRRGRHALAGT